VIELPVTFSPSKPPPRAASVAPGTSQVKGVAFRTVLWSVEHLFGPQQVNAMMEHMGSEPRQALHYGQLVSGGWYPVSWYAELLTSIVKSTNGGLDVIRNVANLCVDHDIRGVYRFLVEHLNPGTVVTVYSKLFPRYYTPGKVTVDRESNTHFALRVQNCFGFSGLMWHEIYASGKYLLTLSGASNVRHRLIEGGKDGDTHMTVEARWD
jgi:hypothetical protein